MSNSRRILTIFENYDADGDGFISKEELSFVMKAVGYDGDINDLLDAADLDGDGKISFAEFVDWLELDDSTVPEAIASGQMQGEKQKVAADLKANIATIKEELEAAQADLAAMNGEAAKLAKTMADTAKVEEQKDEKNRDPAKLEEQKVQHQQLEEQKLEKQRDINDKCKKLDELLTQLNGGNGDAHSTERLSNALKTSVQ